MEAVGRGWCGARQAGLSRKSEVGVQCTGGAGRRRVSRRKKLCAVSDVVKVNNVRTVKVPLNWPRDGC